MFSGLQEAKEIKVYNSFSVFESDYLSNASKDTTYVINFWATWCAPCVKELPHFEKLNKENKDEPVQITLVSLDFKSNVEKGVKPLVSRMGLANDVVVLADGKASEWIDLVDSTWSGAIPATLVIKNGKRHFFEKSYDTYSELEEEINNIR